MAAQLATVRNNDAPTDIAVVRNVGIRHDKNIVGNTRAAAPLDSAPVERAIFADGTVLPYFEASRFATILEVLRGCAEDGTVKNVRVCPNRDAAVHVNSRFKNYARADFRPLVHQTPGANRSCFVDSCLRVDK